MSIVESLVVSLFCIALVFLVLSCLFVLVRILSKLLGTIGARRTVISAAKAPIPPVVEAVEGKDANSGSAGELKLINVDERTAAMIMAIVSHESQIPLSQLSFKSIKALEES